MAKYVKTLTVREEIDLRFIFDKARSLALYDKKLALDSVREKFVMIQDLLFPCNNADLFLEFATLAFNLQLREYAEECFILSIKLYNKYYKSYNIYVNMNIKVAEDFIKLINRESNECKLPVLEVPHEHRYEESKGDDPLKYHCNVLESLGDSKINHAQDENG